MHNAQHNECKERWIIAYGGVQIYVVCEEANAKLCDMAYGGTTGSYFVLVRRLFVISLCKRFCVYDTYYLSLEFLWYFVIFKNKNTHIIMYI